MLDKTIVDWQSAAESLDIEGRAFINGDYVDAESGATRPSINPANGQVLAEVACCDASDADRAVAGARVLADGPSSNSRILNGSRITRIWETGQLPVSLDVTSDLGEQAGNAYREGFTGTSLYVADLPPGSDLDDVPMHAQDSLDYIAVLDGEIDLVLPDGPITMRQGDILVQAGNMHSWVNRSDRYCRLLVVVLTGQRDG